MAIRLEKSGGLYLIRGRSETSEEQPEKPNVGLWLILSGLVLVILFAPELLSQWPATLHAIREVLGAVQ